MESTAVYVYGDGLVGVVRGQSAYALIKPQVILVATGAREKSLIFPGNTLPGVYGAGAFQTLVNRDLVAPAEKLFVVGGGNVGLIAAYHALQAGIEVVGLVEALPACGGYKVHEDKIRRLGVPVYTSRTVLSANGADRVESVTTAAVDDKFQPIAGTEQTFDCDTLLIAVGLNPVDEFIHQAEAAGVKVFAAGDAKEIAEASSAMFNGKIAGVEIARELGREEAPIPEEWRTKAKLLKSHPGPATPPDYDGYPETGATPIFHCTQDIPCNPCTSVCDRDVIRIEGDPLLNKPRPVNDECIGCLKCLMICPGLAVTLVDYRKDEANPTVSLAYEVYNHALATGDRVKLTDYEGRPLGQARGRADHSDQGVQPDPGYPGQGPQGDCQANSRVPDHPRRVGRAQGPDRHVRPARRGDRLSLRTGYGRGDPGPDQGRRDRPEPDQGDHPGRHGGLRIQDLPEPDHATDAGRGGRPGGDHPQHHPAPVR